VNLAQVWTDYPTNFSFQNHYFILIEISITKITQTQYLTNLKSKNLQITFIKSCSLRAFQEMYQESAQIP
jgi:hypothetical protein